jgi:hypothetical protein
MEYNLARFDLGARVLETHSFGGADGIVSRPLKKTEEKPLNSRLSATY